MKGQIEFSLTTHCERYHYVASNIYCPENVSRYDEMFEIRDDVIYCNMTGAMFIMRNFRYNFDDYKKAILYLDQVASEDYEEELPELDLGVHLKFDENRFCGIDNSDKLINEYISDRCVKIPLSGKSIDGIDISKLHKRDIETLNGTVNVYNTSAKEGLDTEYVRMGKVHRYVENNDPESIYRSFYYHDYDPIAYDDYIERFSFSRSEDKILRKIHKLEKKKSINTKKKKKNKKNK